MDMDMGIDFDRLMFFEHSRKAAEASYAKNPFDADNLTRWGGALIELAQFQNSTAASKQMLLDASSKLEEALEVNPRKHDAMWCLGNAYTTQAFVTPDFEEAKPYFQKATVCYQQAVEEDPTNELYKNSFEVSAKAPELHAEIKNNMGVAASSHSTRGSSKKKETSGLGISDFAYDVMGWICLGVGTLVWVGFAKHHIPPTI
ncbi:hypothetical protein KSS87_003162 [Heliosperma pusillum]|nr:hypothetical protein KSS87_003162 [Heliosperma pusillum]